MISNDTQSHHQNYSISQSYIFLIVFVVLLCSNGLFIVFFLISLHRVRIFLRLHKPCICNTNIDHALYLGDLAIYI